MIPAGGSGKLVAKVATHANQAGHLTKSVLVETDEVGVQPLRLQLSFTVQPLVVTEPASRAAVDAVVGQGATTTVTLSRRDGKPLEIGAVTSNPPGLLEATVMPAADGHPSSQRSLVLKVSPQDDASVRIVRLSIPVNVDKDPVVTYPVAVRIRPVVEVQPRQLRFVVGEPGRTPSQMGVRLVDNRGRAFRVRSLESSNPELFVAHSAARNEKATEHRVTVVLAPGLDAEKVPGVVHGTVTVTTDEPGGAPLRIPVFVARAGGVERPPQPLRERPTLQPPPVPVPYQGGSR